MHDPCTVAFEIRYPWYNEHPWPKNLRKLSYKEAEKLFPKGKKYGWVRNGYRKSFITIWHRDPESDGSDDSCGWAFPKPSQEQCTRLRSFARNEARNKYYLRYASEKFTGDRDLAESLYRGLILNMCERVGISINYDEAAKMASLNIHGSDCWDAAGVFCFLHGYHTNGEYDDRQQREDYFYGECVGILRQILRKKRKWWQHPKWHFWHWEFQVHPWQQFQRRYLDRCERCNNRIKNGVAMSTTWDSRPTSLKEKILFWRGNKDLMCEKCHADIVYVSKDSNDETTCTTS